jgi:anti-sigma factor (TIGR02949 family)
MEWIVKGDDAMSIIEISCVEVWREISNYLDGEISAELRERLRAHFEVCDHCTAVLDGARNVVQLVGDGRTFPMPEGFSARLYKKINALR